MSNSPYTTCAYIGRPGPCNKRCFGGRCNTHRNKISLTMCQQKCGHGTRSQTGFCSHCGWRQNHHGHRLKRERCEMDRLILEILAWDWVSSQHPTIS